MEKYLVGGAVRDRLLGLPVKDRDWVVVGRSVEQMLDAGYKPVGQDFPVFLHPRTHEEHALARTERKTGTGYLGFTVHASPDVTLEQDLQRRDLTINAMAQTADGQLIDPFGGEQDIRNRVLRHVSPAFSEDPVRLLRVARFAARLADFKFSVAPETLVLMQDLVAAGEVDTLVPERVWQELNAALASETPGLFFSTLRDAKALKVLLPEIDKLFGIAQPAASHPEIDTGLHTMLVLEQASRLSDKPATRFAALCHDVGKGLTPTECLPEHDGHEAAGVPLVEGLCKRLRVPNDYRDLALITCRYHGHIAEAAQLNASALASLLTSLDCLRKPDRFEQFLLACEADCRGRTGFENGSYRRFDYVRAAEQTFASVNAAEIALAQSDKSTIKSKVFEARVTALNTFIAESGYSA